MRAFGESKVFGQPTDAYEGISARIWRETLGVQRVYLRSLSRSVVASRRECVIAGMCKYTNDVNAQVSALVQGRRGQKDPRKFETQERFQTSMARPRSKSHRLICLRQVVSQARELSVIVFLEQTLQCASVGSNTRSAGKALSFPDAKRYMSVVGIRENIHRCNRYKRIDKRRLPNILSRLPLFWYLRTHLGY